MLAWLAAAAWAAPTVVWISLDTTRADALSCYGDFGQPVFTGADLAARTPVLDALAASGIRYERAFAHAPTTLSSHASVFTGLDPHGHGVVRNGFPLARDVPTVAEQFRAAGYRTVAVLGAAALEQSMGLDRGFNLYDDRMTARHGLMYQRRGDEVVDAALTHSAKRTDAPLFLFVHLYDPHAPYAAPEPFGARFVDPDYTGPYRTETLVRPLVEAGQAGQDVSEDVAWLNGSYLGEVAWVDAQVGRLLEGLTAQGRLEDALIVVHADHGETLTESWVYAWSHGSSVDPEVVRVPLIIAAKGRAMPQGRVVKRTVGLQGLPSTVLEVAGLEALPNTPDFSDTLQLGPVWDADGWPERPTRPVFFEATRPRQFEQPDQWNNLGLWRGVALGEAEGRMAPVYQIGLDAGPYSDLLQGLVERWDAEAPGHRDAEMGPQTRKALLELGYLEE